MKLPLAETILVAFTAFAGLMLASIAKNSMESVGKLAAKLSPNNGCLISSQSFSPMEEQDTHLMVVIDNDNYQ